jgi:hypothetical protein
MSCPEIPGDSDHIGDANKNDQSMLNARRVRGRGCSNRVTMYYGGTSSLKICVDFQALQSVLVALATSCSVRYMSPQHIDYSERQRERDREYRAAHAEWLASLSDEERAAVEKLGLTADPLTEPVSHSAYSRDAAELPVADKREAPTTENEDPRWEVIRLIMSQLIESKNTRLEVEILALVSGVCWVGGEPIKLAKRFGLHRAAISARAVRICEIFGLPPSRVMRTMKARQAAKSARKRSLKTR